mmetsp:Transcript_33238/g.74359  ORF Transcript_33238/g.74359 Transcript_33238/m.74359 type:complete len:289 (+) Transcript_33238:1206-2072(+)
MDGHCLDFQEFLDIGCKLVHHHLGLRKNQYLSLGNDGGKVIRHPGPLRLIVLHHHPMLHHLVGSFPHRTNRDPNRILQGVPREVLDFRGERRGEQQRLPVWANVIADTADLSFEPHRQHSVRLVKHQVRSATEIGGLHLHQINQTTGCCSHNLTAPLQLLPLVPLRHATSEHHIPDVKLEAEFGCLTIDLDGEFAGGAEDHPDGTLVLCQIPLIHHMHNQRQQIRSSFTTASLSDSDQITTIHRSRDSLRLDRGRRRVAVLANRSHESLVEPGMRERYNGLGHSCSRG